jgi:hypothetical protein
MIRRSEPVDLPLLLSQTNYNWSLAPVEANVDSATHDMVAQYGAGDQPQMDLLSTYEDVVPFVGDEEVCGGRFTFTTIPNEL